MNVLNSQRVAINHHPINFKIEFFALFGVQLSQGVVRHRETDGISRIFVGHCRFTKGQTSTLLAEGVMTE